MRRTLVWGLLIGVAACSSQGGTLLDTQKPLGHDAATDAAPRQQVDAHEDLAEDASSGDAATSLRLTPSNLPPDICDTPGTADLTVPGSQRVDFDASVPCDVLVPQAEGLPSICVRKFANITISGTLSLRPLPNGNPALALVATGSIAVEGTLGGGYGGQPGASDPRGGGADGDEGIGGGGGPGGGGAGHITRGAYGYPSYPPGNAYGPTTGTQLVAGAKGGNGGGLRDKPPGGSGGAALQVVSCGELRIAGTITASGGNGASGGSARYGVAGGGGGGSGGTLLVEAMSISGSGGRLLATGGAGGQGGDIFGGSSRGGAGGRGGTGSSAPEQGQAPTPPGSGEHISGGGGGGGAIGRTIVNVPEGVPLPAFTSDPPAAIGTVGTH